MKLVVGNWSSLKLLHNYCETAYKITFTINFGYFQTA